MFAEAKGARVFFDIQGPQEGPRVVLLHGWGCDSTLMNPVAENLSRNHRVLALDFPGHGKSGRPPEPWGVPEYAACLKELLEEQRFFPCAAVAHSFGCRVAACLAAENPGLFNKMVFTGAAGLKAPVSEESRKRSERYRKEKEMAQKIGRIPGLGRLSGRMMEQLRQKYGSADYKALDEEMRATFVKVIGQDLREMYPRIACPVLLIWGEQDQETPLWMGQEMEKLIPDAGLAVFEGGTHFAYLEQIGRFNTVLNTFL